MSLWFPALLMACGGPSADDAKDVSTTDVVTVPTADTSASVLAETDLDVLLAGLTEAMEGEGHGVAVGSVGVSSLEDCCGWPSCQKRNASTWYGVYALPYLDDEPPRPLGPGGDELAWRMRSDEAVVYLGKTPPRAAYVGFRTYVHDRYSEYFDLRLPGPVHLGDTLNHLVWGDAGDGDGPFGATLAVISTMDRALADEITAALVAAGLPERAVNVDPMPVTLVEHGLHDNADSVRMNLRVVGADDADAMAAFFEGDDAVAVRITPASPRQITAYPEQSYFRPSGSPTDEEALRPAVDELRQAIIDAHPTLVPLEADANVREPDDDEMCWGGCNRDVTYANTVSFPLPTTGPDVKIVVYGVNHAASGQATYHNVVVFGTDNDDPAATVGSDRLAGSASAYLPGHPDADQLYAWTLARDCAGAAFCSEIAEACPGVEADERAAIHWRSYLDPATGTHPRYDEMVVDSALFLAEPE